MAHYGNSRKMKYGTKKGGSIKTSKRKKSYSMKVMNKKK